MEPLKYYFLIDNSVQWFAAVVVCAPDKTQRLTNLPNGLDGPFIANILNREANFTNKKFGHDNQSWQGWSISEKEYNRIIDLINLHPSVERFNKLINY